MNSTDDSLEHLMHTYASPLLRYAERLVRNNHAAQDVVQQVFIRFARLDEDRRPNDGSVRAWLYRVAHNQAVDLIRAEQRRKKLHEDHAEIRGAEDRGALRDLRREVLEQVHLLDEKQRGVLLLRLEEGLSYKEIAEVTGLKQGYVGYLLHQAVRTLSTHLADRRVDA